MKIEDIFTVMDKIVSRVSDKAASARRVARAAHRQGNVRKRDKFNVVARVYEMLRDELGPLSSELVEHTPAEFREKTNDDLPF